MIRQPCKTRTCPALSNAAPLIRRVIPGTGSRDCLICRVDIGDIERTVFGRKEAGGIWIERSRGYWYVNKKLIFNWILSANSISSL